MFNETENRFPYDKVVEGSGVVAVFGHPDAANLAYLCLYALQHRGQNSAGVASSDGHKIRYHRGMGRVSELFTPAALGNLSGDLAIGQTGSSSSGDNALLNVQPLLGAFTHGGIAVAHNGNITNAAELRRALELDGSCFQSSSDSELVLHLVARSHECTFAGALREALLQLKGAFSIVHLTEQRVVVARDRHGFRPLVLGRMELSSGAVCHVVASETCAFDLIDAQYIRDIEPGEILTIGPEGITRERFAPVSARAQCLFEQVYLSRIDSITFGRPVQQSREQMGRLLARECAVDADIVVPIPESGVASAIGYAAESGIPYRNALLRSHYVGRAFIEPSQVIRDFTVKLKLNPIRHLLEGKRVVLVDDSIVRGTTSRLVARMVRNAGAREIHLRIASPPTISPCFYGVDTKASDLIAAGHSIEDVRRFLDVDTLAYLSLGAVQDAVSDCNNAYCYACYTGDYPTDLVNIEDLAADKDS